MRVRTTKPALALALLLASASGEAMPLHAAAACGYETVVTMRLAAGADLDARDDDGPTPPDRVIRCERQAVVEVLRAARAMG